MAPVRHGRNCGSADLRLADAALAQYVPRVLVAPPAYVGHGKLFWIRSGGHSWESSVEAGTAFFFRDHDRVSGLCLRGWDCPSVSCPSRPRMGPSPRDLDPHRTDGYIPVEPAHYEIRYRRHHRSDAADRLASAALGFGRPSR